MTKEHGSVAESSTATSERVELKGLYAQMLGVWYPRNYLVAAIDPTQGTAAVKALLSAQPSSGRDERFMALQNWVEKGKAPETIQVKSSNSSVSLLLCVYPLKITYRGNGSAKAAASYSCN
jgi:feruloyl esterase